MTHSMSLIVAPIARNPAGCAGGIVCEDRRVTQSWHHHHRYHCRCQRWSCWSASPLFDGCTEGLGRSIRRGPLQHGLCGFEATAVDVGGAKLLDCGHVQGHTVPESREHAPEQYVAEPWAKRTWQLRSNDACGCDAYWCMFMCHDFR